MTLFDVIRYPLSTYATTEEVESLPKPIRELLRSKLKGNSLHLSPVGMATILRIYQRQPANRHLAESIREDIRKALEEL